MKYIITGGAGFIGSNLARALVKRHHTVKIIDNLSTGTRKNLKDIEDKIEFVKGDITNLPILAREFKDFDFVLHHGAMASVAESIERPDLCHKTNVTGTLNVLLMARDTNIKRVIFASSAAVYGDNVAKKNSEAHMPDPCSPYAVSKLTGEYYCKLFWQLYKLPTISLRYFNVYGPYQDLKSNYSAVIPIFIKHLLKNKQPIIYGTGKQSRDFVYIDDVVNATLCASKARSRAYGQTFNIGTGTETSINELFGVIQQSLGKKHINPLLQPARQGDITSSHADTRLAQNLLNFKAETNITHGIKRYLATGSLL